jgi:hypothetical protein
MLQKTEANGEQSCGKQKTGDRENKYQPFALNYWGWRIKEWSDEGGIGFESHLQ